MPNPQEDAVVRFFSRADGEAVGVGFLVSDRHVMTCAHVVAAALGSVDGEYAREMPPGEVQLDFPIASTDERLSARVVAWSRDLPPGAEASVEEHELADIAVLELAAPRPAGTAIVQFSMDDPAGHPMRAYGVPANRPQGRWATGEFLPAIQYRRVEIRLDLLAPGRDEVFDEDIVSRGFSGAVAWDTSSNAAMGMLVGARPSRARSYMIRARQLRRVWRGLSISEKRPAPATSVSVVDLLSAVTLIDRDDQAFDIKNGLRGAARVSPKKPCIAMIRGGRREGHTGFIDRIQHEILPAALGADTLREDLRPLGWPTSVQRGLDTCLQQLLDGLSYSLGCEQPTAEAFRDAINRYGAPVGFSMLIDAEKLDAGHIRLLQRWLEFWDEVAGLQPGLNHVVVVVLCFQYVERSAHGFLGRLWRRRGIDFLDEFLARKREQAQRDLQLVILDDLPMISMVDVEAWLNGRLLSMRPDLVNKTHLLVSRFRNHFGDEPFHYDELVNFIMQEEQVF